MVAPLPESVTVATLPGTRRSLLRIGLLSVQLGLVAAVIHEFRLESRAFYQLLLLALLAFPLHALLPLAARLPAFGVLSLAGLVLVLKLKAAAFVLVVGAVLVGICHLPFRWTWRLVLLLGAALGLMALRSGVVATPIPEGIWPVIGAIFMFRLALYAHALRLREAPAGFWPSLTYFAMLPNVAFPLFPVVDYKAFTTNYYNAPDMLVYERGMRWIVRGVLHLLAYRLVYHHLALDPLNVVSLGELVQFMVSTFLLYLRVSGQFHVIVGLLHLFGFNLPETHRLYYLASSFTDLWRRINLYWTDFMMKLVYYPSFFRLRRFGQLRALLLSTALVFMATWALHGWQTYWLLGDAHFSVPDALFWGILAVLVLVTTVRESGKPRRPRQRGWRLGRALAVTGTFLGMSLLWSLWSSESVGDWLSLFYAASRATPRELLWLGVLLAAGLAVAGWPWGAVPLGQRVAEVSPALGAQVRAGGGRILVLSAILVLATRFGQELLPQPARALAQSLGEDRLNASDAARRQRGYYEQLNSASRTGGQTWEALATRPRGWHRALDGSEYVAPADGVLLLALKPNISFTRHLRPFTTNEWGMRDRSYPQARVGDAVRIAVLGPSIVMGYGVGDGESFESQLEERLAQLGPVEILNFGFEGHSLTQQLAAFDRQVRPFAPDLVLVALTPTEHRLAAAHIRQVVNSGAAVEYGFLADVIDAAGVRPGDEFASVVRRLRPHQARIEENALAMLQARVTSSGARLAAMSMRMPTQPMGQLRVLEARARKAGLPVLDLTRAFDGLDEDSLRVAPWDEHPNADAHRLLSRVLEQELLRAGMLPRWRADAPDGG